MLDSSGRVCMVCVKFGGAVGRFVRRECLVGVRYASASICRVNLGRYGICIPKTGHFLCVPSFCGTDSAFNIYFTSYIQYIPLMFIEARTRDLRITRKILLLNRLCDNLIVSIQLTRADHHSLSKIIHGDKHKNVSPMIPYDFHLIGTVFV